MSLPEAISREIHQMYEKKLASGDLLTIDQLNGYYSLFRQKFSPDRLSNIDGEELLDYMHNTSNRNSLVYWLEFKNDDEFPALFGSIAGGSSLKFGLYRRRETGQWTTGSPQNQRVLSISEAIQIARSHREQLLAGCKLLEKLTINASDEAYIHIQEDMEQQAPDICDTAWGHKYFHLMSPEKLDDYHVAYFQRFYLIKLLQTPVEREGRFTNAGRYVEIAKEFLLPTTILTTLINQINGRPHRYWRIGTRSNDTGESWWDEMKEGGFVSVGWDKLGDLSWVKYNQESKDRLRRLMSKTYCPNSPAAAGRNSNKLFNFATVIGNGDIVLASDGMNIHGIGRVNGEYEFTKETDWPHRRPVEWLSLETWPLPEREGLLSAVSELRKVPNLLEIERHLRYTTPPQVIPQTRARVTRLPGIAGHIQDVLERKRQVILYGPPGTGKTFWAYQTALQLAARMSFGKYFEELNKEQQDVIIGNGEALGLVCTCTFHPSYGYEDFIEGYRPVIINDQPAFHLVDGIFKRMCQDAVNQTKHKFFLIIDEINRGDIPRIFGELITLLEKDKRDKPVLLPISGQSFHVPDNLYIIGTMNTADRSIALLDAALRRRFGFIELMPDPSLLDITLANGLPLGLWLAALNQRIVTAIGRDARNLQVGHAYFLDNGKPVSDFAQFSRILQEDVLPLLEEYSYEDFDALEKILGPLVDRTNQRLRHELFDPNRQDDLLQALLTPSPEIASVGSVPLPQDVVEETDDDAS